MDFRTAFGQVLRDARKSVPMSQEALAEAAGLHNNTISKMERGELSPSVDTVVLVCAAMGYEPWQLFLEAGLLADQLEMHAIPGNHDLERPRRG